MNKPSFYYPCYALPLILFLSIIKASSFGNAPPFISLSPSSSILFFAIFQKELHNFKYTSLFPAEALIEGIAQFVSLFPPKFKHSRVFNFPAKLAIPWSEIPLSPKYHHLLLKLKSFILWKGALAICLTPMSLILHLFNSSDFRFGRSVPWIIAHPMGPISFLPLYSFDSYLN